MLERQSSMASSTEEVSGVPPHESAESLDDHEAQQFGVIREFDFLEYELESQEVSRRGRCGVGTESVQSQRRVDEESAESSIVDEESARSRCVDARDRGSRAGLVFERLGRHAWRFDAAERGAG